MRVAFATCLVLGATACSGRTLDLGGGSDAGPSAAGGMDIVTCSDPAATSATLGSGNYGTRRGTCSESSGTAAAATTTDQVASLLVGLWYDCTEQNFGIDFEGTAVELTSEGHYIGYGTDNNGTLMPLSSLNAATPSSTGTYTVVDGSATYGPGTFELQLRPADGGLFTGQVVVTANPSQIQFFPLNQAEQAFTPPLPWSARKGVCSCVNATEVPEFEDDATGLTNAMMGKWMWCGGGGPPAGNIGIEFAAGSTWYGLIEDSSGNVTRDTAALDHGTFQIVPTSSLPPPAQGSEPLSLVLNQGTDDEDTEVLFFPNPRVLLVGVGTTSGPTGTVEVYSTCFPMP